jgi:hypothetical protein
MKEYIPYIKMKFEQILLFLKSSFLPYLFMYKIGGHEVTFLCWITSRKNPIVAILFFDVTDIIHLKMDQKETTLEACQDLLWSHDSWSQLLIATGRL